MLSIALSKRSLRTNFILSNQYYAKCTCPKILNDACFIQSNNILTNNFTSVALHTE